MEYSATVGDVRPLPKQGQGTRLLALFGLDWPRPTRTIVGVGLAVAFALAVVPLTRAFGVLGGAFVIIPIAAVGWLLGPLVGGLLAGLFVVLNTLALTWVGTPGWEAPLQNGKASDIAITFVFSLLIGLATGGLRRLGLRMQQQGVALIQQGVALGASSRRCVLRTRFRGLFNPETAPCGGTCDLNGPAHDRLPAAISTPGTHNVAHSDGR